MVKVCKIATILFVLVVICAPSCGDEQAVNREEAIVNETRNQIRTEFELDYLTEATLFAYETAARQKITDLIDYFNVLTDSSLDISFREKAGDMVKRTFLSEKTSLQLFPQKSKPMQGINVGQLITEGLENKLTFQGFRCDAIRIHKSLQRTGNKTYSGTFLISLNFEKPNQPRQMLNSIEREVDFYALKQEKVFGKDTLNIWTVKLGAIR